MKRLCAGTAPRLIPVLSLLHFTHQLLVPTCQCDLLIIEQCHAAGVYGVNDVLQALDFLVWDEVEQHPTEPCRTEAEEEGKQAPEVA